MLMVKGDRVDFVRLDGTIFKCPRDFIVMHDVSGQDRRRCDFYVCSYSWKRCDVCDVDPVTLREFRKYYGNQAVPEVGTIAVPKGPWHRAYEIDAIRYRRRHVPQRGFKDIPYRHLWNDDRHGLGTFKYSVPVWVEENGLGAYRMPLPEGCVVDERGYVSP
jgi:hypothetical protein